MKSKRNEVLIKIFSIKTLLITSIIFYRKKCQSRLDVAYLLAYELYLKNKDDEDEVGSNAPIKKVFVNFIDPVTVQLDPEPLEHYGESLKPNEPRSYFQGLLSMPSNNLASVGLPNRGTGANSKKPYVEFYGKYEKSKLSLAITGGGQGQKETYEYTYNFENSKEPIITTPVDLLLLRLDTKSYFVDDKLLFEIYRDAGVITPEGALPSKVFIEVCGAFFSFWKETIVSEELKKFSRFSFRIVVLPYPLTSQVKVEYRNQEEVSTGEPFEDCFGNQATDYPSIPTVNAKFFSFDDKAFTINCKIKKDFYQNLGVGNESFSKINLPSDRVVKIGDLEWYFFDLSDPTLNFDTKGFGIYDKLYSNYEFLSKQSGRSVQEKSVLKVVCAKRAQAKIELLLDENLTFDQLKEMFGRAHGDLNSNMALELLIIDGARDIIWVDYITAIRYFMNGTYFDRTFLVQRFTRILRNKLWDWLKGKKDSDNFFGKSQFCLKLLTKTEWGKLMNKNEEYAYKIGIIAGKYVKFKQTAGEVNNSTKDILTYSKYDREHLRFVYKRVGIGLNLSKVNTDELSKSIKTDTPKGEIDDAQANDDYSYFFYKGVFENLT
ncbi:MAG: hypothetical protein FWG55_03875 [Candidatus Bathyarchaeota archaeon]|nr:hypothetical protein [Candidatus Termiticorpusculum sp.]